MTGNIVAFGYEAEGFGSDDVSMFEITPQGKIIWNAKIQVPYVGMLHDFAVTEKHIVFYVIPLAIDEAQIEDGGIHWSWDGQSRPTSASCAAAATARTCNGSRARRAAPRT